jgi:hypothetical protein
LGAGDWALRVDLSPPPLFDSQLQERRRIEICGKYGKSHFGKSAGRVIGREQN